MDSVSLLSDSKKDHFSFKLKRVAVGHLPRAQDTTQKIAAERKHRAKIICKNSYKTRKAQPEMCPTPHFSVKMKRMAFGHCHILHAHDTPQKTASEGAECRYRAEMIRKNSYTARPAQAEICSTPLKSDSFASKLNSSRRTSSSSPVDTEKKSRSSNGVRLKIHLSGGSRPELCLCRISAT
jgi:hypothetical protein